MSYLSLILDRDRAGTLQLWACRGVGKGCRRNTFRTTKARCDDCYGPLPNEMTLEQVQAQLERGDA